MALLGANPRWSLVVKMMILLYGMFLQNHLSDSSESCGPKNILFISAGGIGSQVTFPNGNLYQGGKEIQLCFNIQPNEFEAGCCRTDTFKCDIRIHSTDNKTYSLTMDKEVLSKQDVVVIINRNLNFSCMKSQNNGTTEFFLNTHLCWFKGGQNVRLSQDRLEKKKPCNESDCKDSAGRYSEYTIVCKKPQYKCCLCEPRNENKPDNSIVLPDDNQPMSPKKAENIMNNLTSLLGQMGDDSAAALKIGNITGVLAKMSPQNLTSMNFGFTASGDMNILEENADLPKGITRAVRIPNEAIVMAIRGNSSLAGVLLFPGMPRNDPNSFFLNDEMVGIEMGVKISSLSQTIDIHFTNVPKSGKNASCRSWDGKGDEPNWITDGCETNEANGSITCQCSHLTFFAILMSSPPENISTSDFNSLTYITSTGCGVSMFFLAVALMMHFVMRKTSASKATKILMNLFIAMFFLNFTFLVNETIAGLDNSIACVMIAVALHYSMLATFTWFFMQGLHLYFNLLEVTARIKHYMRKILITGWVTPAVVVIVLLALQKYDDIAINTDDGNSAKMCWIVDPAVHRGVNIGFYAVVFVFTLSIFIATVWRITQFKSAALKAEDKSSTKIDISSILGLFLLLGITWAFAFFAEGPFLLASYYIFTVLNSFQGFFLFIYYHRSSRFIKQDKKLTQNTCTTATVNTAVTSSG